jgi:hypothetical protein
MSTPRTPDDGRNERQRQQAAEESARQKQREFDDGTHPAARGGVTSGPARRELPKAEGDERRELLEEKPFDFIERTRPEDRLDPAGGQQTRDNVNPNIPSVTPEEVGPPIARVKDPGGIVDPKRLGMESIAGVAPPAAVPYTGENVTPDMLAAHMPSINEPFGSNLTTGDAGPAELPPLVLTDIDPDTLVVGSGSFPLTVTGSGFGPNCVVVFDDVDVPTIVVSPTELTADCPVSATADIVDVEVSRGEEMSDVLSFEFTAVARMSSAKREQQRKPKKAEPPSKRAKKSKK